MSNSIEREPRTNGLWAPDRRPAGPVEVSATRNFAPPGVVAAEPPPPQTAEPADEIRAKRPRVTFEVVRGSLTKAKAPVAVAGRYQGLPVTGPVKEFDYILKSWLTRAFEFRMIGSGLGELFRIPLTRHKKAGEVKADELLLVGMGEPGCFAADDLRFLMTNVTVAIKAMRKGRFGVSLIGSRRGELSVELAARSFMEGLIDGYDRCRGLLDSMGSEQERFHAFFDGDLEVVLVEEGDEKARDIIEAFDHLGRDPEIRKCLELRVLDKGKIPTLKMKGEEEITNVPPREERSTLLRVTCPSHHSGSAAPAGPCGTPPSQGTDDAPPTGLGKLAVFRYSALSQTSTIPVRDVNTNPYFARELPERLMRSGSWAELENFGRLWGNLLVPDEFRTLIEASEHVTLLLDESTARFPWEMVAFRRRSGTRFLGLNYQLTRMFRSVLSAVPGMPPPLNRELRVLIVADPAPGDLALPHAREEGIAVVEALQHAKLLWGDEYIIEATVRIGSHQEEAALSETLKRVWAAREVVKSAKPCEPLELLALIVNERYNEPFDVVHYAGHGDFHPSKGRMGWVFDKDCVLSAEEIFRIRQVPRLVFANACFSSTTSNDCRQRQRISLAQAFFARGIQNYIGTGWEVQDESAGILAAQFYRQALGVIQGDEGVEKHGTARPATLSNSLANARRAIKDRWTTWGAYQHYGQANTLLLAVPQQTAKGG